MSVSALHYHRDWELSSLSTSSRNGLLVKLAGSNKTVLEMGCATGFLSRHFAANGCTVTGVEYDPISARRAEQFCSRVIVADLNGDWKESVSGKFDVITFGDVLEHLLDPVAVLSECRDLLASNGKVIISLPNVAFLSNRFRLMLGEWDYTETGLLDRTHLKFFTLKSAKQMIFDAGFRIESFEPISGLRGARIPGVQSLTRLLPNLFGFQFIFSTARREY